MSARGGQSSEPFRARYAGRLLQVRTRFCIDMSPHATPYRLRLHSQQVGLRTHELDCSNGPPSHAWGAVAGWPIEQDGSGGSVLRSSTVAGAVPELPESLIRGTPASRLTPGTNVPGDLQREPRTLVAGSGLVKQDREMV